MTIETLAPFIEMSMLGFFLIIGITGYRQERKEWNNGICAENGLPWMQFDRSSQGCRGYKAGDIYCWISYPGIDKKR